MKVEFENKEDRESYDSAIRYFGDYAAGCIRKYIKTERDECVLRKGHPECLQISIPVQNTELDSLLQRFNIEKEQVEHSVQNYMYNYALKNSPFVLHKGVKYTFWDVLLEINGSLESSSKKLHTTLTLSIKIVEES